MSTFSLTLSERHRCVIAACSGSLDLAAVVAERDRLSAAAASGPCLFVLDLGGVTFLDSTALGLFVVLHRRLAQHGGALVLANVDRRVRDAYVRPARQLHDQSTREGLRMDDLREHKKLALRQAA